MNLLGISRPLAKWPRLRLRLLEALDQLLQGHLHQVPSPLPLAQTHDNKQYQKEILPQPASGSFGRTFQGRHNHRQDRLLWRYGSRRNQVTGWLGLGDDLGRQWLGHRLDQLLLHQVLQMDASQEETLREPRFVLAVQAEEC
jgi:hypothetical protein